MPGTFGMRDTVKTGEMGLGSFDRALMVVVVGSRIEEVGGIDETRNCRIAAGVDNVKDLCRSGTGRLEGDSHGNSLARHLLEPGIIKWEI